MKALQTTTNTELDQSLTDIAGQLSSTSKRIYVSDARIFAQWLVDNALTPATMTRSHMIAYRLWLDTTSSKKTGKAYSKAAKQRMFAVASKIMKEQYLTGKAANVTEEVKGFKVNDETTHTALTKTEAKDMLESIDTSTIAGKRDYALMLLLLKTGLRRTELAELDRSHIKTFDGHVCIIVEHGKGDKKRIVKLRTEVKRAIDAYLAALPEQSQDTPLFVSIRRGDHPTMQRMSDKAVELIVKKYAPAQSDLTPHGLRATYATLALENGASLQQVQYSLGHKDPRTTERYQKRKLNLDDNAVDYLNF